MTLAEIPDEIDLTQPWLLEYWSSQLGVSSQRLRQSVGIVGNKVSRIRKYLKDGSRISILENGVEYLVARIGTLNDGFHLSVPYHSCNSGVVFKIPYTYSKKTYIVPLSESDQFTVSDHVKLSMHMTGFVQFSTLGKKIVSGFNQQLQRPKGVGVNAPSPVCVTTGPLCGIFAQGLSGFQTNSGKPSEVFIEDDFWHHPDFSEPGDDAINLEFFMFDKADMAGVILTKSGQQILTRELPFGGRFRFPFHLRVIEIPHLDFFLGLIVSRVSCDNGFESGYKLSGPGCFTEDGKPFGINAWYPVPEFLSDSAIPSLDFVPT